MSDEMMREFENEAKWDGVCINPDTNELELYHECGGDIVTEENLNEIIADTMCFLTNLLNLRRLRNEY